MVELTQNDCHISVSMEGEYIGSIHLYENPYHKRNLYIDLDFKRLDSAISAELFYKMARIKNRPFQAMVSSKDVSIVDFLTSGGFVLARRSFDVTASGDSYMGTNMTADLHHAHFGESKYDICCNIMYERYIKTHQAINPWTASLKDFLTKLSGEVIYEMQNGRIVNLAFVEENEIAYCYSYGEELFDRFASALLSLLFSRHDLIYFECDDCDWVFMKLRAMLGSHCEESFDTYIYKKSADAGN